MKRMLERNITDDDVRSYMKNAKAMFVQWNGKRQLFVCDEGMSLIAKKENDWIYKTVWSKYDFDQIRKRGGEEEAVCDHGAWLGGSEYRASSN